MQALCLLQFAALLLCVGPALTQPEPEPGSDDDTKIGAILSDDGWSLDDAVLRDFTLYWENDGTVPNLIDDTDRYYTNGVGFEFSSDPSFTPELAERFAPADGWENPRFGLGLALKQRIYTSEFITDPTPPASDHPYSGYLYLGLSFQRADDKKHDHFELDLGVVGERSGAEATQKFIHNAFPDEDDPQGWGNQLANELAINFNYERTWKSERGEVSGVGFEMLPAVGFDLGNVAVKARAKVTLRAGMNLPNDFGPPSFLGHKDHTACSGAWGKGDFSFYLYTTIAVEGVAHDIFLDGNTFAGSVSTDSEPFVAMASLGVVARYGSMYAGWTQNFQTETFETQSDGQSFGSLVLGVSFNY